MTSESQIKKLKHVLQFDVIKEYPASISVFSKGNMSFIIKVTGNRKFTFNGLSYKKKDSLKGMQYRIAAELLEELRKES